jgi:hypothetical protein
VIYNLDTARAFTAGKAEISPTAIDGQVYRLDPDGTAVG